MYVCLPVFEHVFCVSECILLCTGDHCLLDTIIVCSSWTLSPVVQLGRLLYIPAEPKEYGASGQCVCVNKQHSKHTSHGSLRCAKLSVHRTSNCNLSMNMEIKIQGHNAWYHVTSVPSSSGCDGRSMTET